MDEELPEFTISGNQVRETVPVKHDQELIEELARTCFHGSAFLKPHAGTRLPSLTEEKNGKVIKKQRTEIDSLIKANNFTE
jgi:hypothetical protein